MPNLNWLLIDKHQIKCLILNEGSQQKPQQNFYEEKDYI